ncbi:hypothetical protein OQA88_4808 [Cercophora sp. LCS_1]
MDQQPQKPHHQRQGSRVRFAEEEPGLEVYQPDKKTKGGTAADNAPEVYWAEDDINDANASQYTFYREGTPTPPEYEEHVNEKGGGYGFGASAAGVAAAGAGAGAGAGSGAGFGSAAATSRGGNFVNLHFDPPPGSAGAEDGGSEKPRRSWRKRRWVVLALVLLFFILPITLGVGLGVGLKNRSAGSAPATSASSDASNLDTTTSPSLPSPDVTLDVTPTPSPAKGTPTATKQATPTTTPQVVEGTLPDCPSGNNTLYTVSGSTKTFLRVCGIDYSGANGATDLAHIYTNSMVECMNVCASYDRCTGCGWGWVEGDTGVSHRCWMKSDLRVSHRARDDYGFGVLQS